MPTKGDKYQVVYVDGDVPQLPIQLGQLLVDSSLIAPGTTNLQQCTSQSPVIYEPLQGGYPITPEEIAAGVVPTNLLYPPGDVRRYGAAETYDVNVDDLPFFEAAIAGLGPNGGYFTGANRLYKIDGTLTISTPVAPRFLTGNTSGSGPGFGFDSDTDAPIVHITTAAVTRNLLWQNFAIVGRSAEAGTDGGTPRPNQHGLVVDNQGFRMIGFVIRACGGSGVVLEHCYGGGGQFGYISLCDGDGMLWDGLVGANYWGMINVAACAGHAYNVASAVDGSDHFDTCAGEQSGGFGWYFDEDVEGFTGVHLYSERNTLGPLGFAVNSNKNQLSFNTWSDSVGEPNPINLGGTQNVWHGRKYLSDVISPKCIQRVYKSYNAVVTGTPNAMVYDDSIPQSNEGLSITGQSITGRRSGNKLVIRGGGYFEGPAGVAIVSVFEGTGTNAIFAKALGTVGANEPIAFAFECESTVPAATGANNDIASQTFSFNVGVAAAGAVTFNGSGGARKLGGAVTGWLSIEEFEPSS